MHLVVHQVVQLEVVHVANGGGALKGVTSASVVQIGLRSCEFQSAFEPWQCHPGMPVAAWHGFLASEAPSNTGVANGTP
jgi:hypothetical protein